MKKIISIILLTVILSGCVKIDTNIPLDKTIAANNKTNIYRKTYNYHLPSSFNIIKNDKYNEVIRSFDLKYYLYIDIISYNSKIDVTSVDDEAYKEYRTIDYKDKKGYIYISEKENKYYIQIMYNYAKIEVITSEDNRDLAITNSLIILSSINYKDDIIDKVVNSDEFDNADIPFNILEKKEKSSNFLDYLEDYGTYEEELPDLDLIN